MPTNDSAPFLGVWTGPAPETVGGLVRVTASMHSVDGSPHVLLDIDALGPPAALADVAVRDGVLEGRMGPTLLRLRRTGHALHGELTSSLLPDLEFELRRGHPHTERYAVPRPSPESAPAATPLPAVKELIADVESGALPWIDSLLVSVQGQPVLDEYFYGRTAENLHSLQSATKSVTALVMATLIADGSVDLDAPAWSYLGHRAGHPWVDQRYDVSVHQVLAMSAGPEWNEQQTSYLDPANDATQMNLAADLVGYVLDRPLGPARPDGHFEYQSGLSMLLGELIRSVAGAPVDVVAQERLFGPMGIDRFHWMTTADGTCHTGGGLWLRPRDFAKFGQLVLNEGQWDGRQLVPAELVRRCVASQSVPAEPVSMVPRMRAYGYQWWLLGADVDGSEVRSASALGFGGQVMHVLPDLDTVLVATAHDWLGQDRVADRLLDSAARIARSAAASR